MVRRAVVSFAVLALVYGLVAELAGPLLPRRIWQGTHYVEDVELLPRYASLAEEAVFLVRAEILQGSLVVSGARLLAGVLLGTLAGVALGLAMARARRLEYLAEPWVAFFRFTPAFALLPLYVLWFGAGEASKVLLIATAVAIVTQQGAFDGARAVPPLYLDAAAALGAPPRLVRRRVVLPAALPHLVTSLRIAVALAWVTLVVAEMIAPEMPSLGYLLTLSSVYPRVPSIVIALATIGALVLVSDALVLAAYHRATRWMRRRHDDR